MIELFVIISFVAGLLTKHSPFGLFAGNFTGIIIFLIAFPTLATTHSWLGNKKALRLLVILTIYTFSIEIFAQKTGIIYGDFSYSNLLGYKVFKSVPWHIPLGYIPLVLGSIIPAKYLHTKIKLHPVLLMTIWILLVDIAIDPAITKSGFWLWEDSSYSFYGVPYPNFFGWFVTAFFASLIYYSFVKKESVNQMQLKGLMFATTVNLAFWAGYAIFSNLMVPVFLSFVLIFIGMKLTTSFNKQLSSEVLVH